MYSNVSQASSSLLSMPDTPSHWETDIFRFDGNIKAWVEDREDVNQALMERERVVRDTGKSIDCNKYNLSYKYFTDVVERKVMEQRKFTIHIIFEISIKQQDQAQDPVEREFKMHLMTKINLDTNTVLEKRMSGEMGIPRYGMSWSSSRCLYGYKMTSLRKWLELEDHQIDPASHF